MPDIAMCKNDTCIKKEECYRFKAVPNDYQNYCDFRNVCVNNEHQWFWQIETKVI